MKRFSVFLKCFMVFAVLSIGMFVLLNTFGLSRMKKKLIEKKTEEMYKQATELVDSHILEYYRQDLDLLDLTDRMTIAAELTGYRIWVTSASGMNIVDTDTDPVVKEYRIVPEHDTTIFKEGVQTDFVLQDLIADPVLMVSVPISMGYLTKGYLSIMIPMQKVYEESSFYNNFVNECLFIFVPILFLAVYTLYEIYFRPINKLTGRIKKYSGDDFKGTFDIAFPSELSDLGGAVKFMGDKINNYNEMQRKFLSNVSHDFRSPLTSIRGYLEAMKDGTIPVEAQEKYFDILLYETDRLTKLTSNILQLNNIDDNGLLLNMVPFDINKMIKQIVLTFEGILKKKKLVINLVFSQKESFVYADPDRIQQVMYNLIDNAVKFSPNDSKLKITTEEKGPKVYVSVKDYGCGIPKESLNKIWDRFYKSDTSRGRDKKGSGLGLSIVKEIINAHGQTISVASTQGVGTEFIFTLKSAE